MDAHTYPGRGLSLQQLVFALNEELKRVAYSPSFASDAISQLDRDASTALATIREWRNSFVPINRIPLDILPLIPTFLSSQRDRFQAASVCRHWRGAFLHHGPIWSQLFLKGGGVCMRNLLERAKGSALDVTICRDPPPGTISFLSPYFRQIRHLELLYSYWMDIITYSEMSSGPLPLLRTLTVSSLEFVSPDLVAPPALPFFEGAINLKQFIFNSKGLYPLSRFVFPNLTTFELSTRQHGWTSDASDLFDFLKASPKLRTVEMMIDGSVTLGSVPQETVTVLPNVETFSLSVGYESDVYEVVARISCPCAKYTSLNLNLPDYHITPGLEIFPTPASWNMITRQYARSLVEEVALEIKQPPEGGIACLLTFRSSDAATVRLASRVYETGEDDVYRPMGEMAWELFSRACSTIQNHPSLSHIKRLHIKHRTAVPHPDEAIPMSNEVGELFDSMGSLDELIIHGCDLHIFLGPFLQDLHYLETPVTFPHIKELTILYPSMEADEDECLDAIVDLAESQYEHGIPFEHVTILAERLPTAMAERLGQWVDVVECYEECYEEECYEEEEG